MKTNHQRGFKQEETAYIGKSRNGSRGVGGFKDFGAKSKVGDTVIMVGASANIHDTTNGKRGVAKRIRGAKKYVRSRIRVREKEALRKVSREEDSLS